MNKNPINENFIGFMGKISIISTKKCSKECGIYHFEKYLCQLENVESVKGMDYQESLSCFERCLNKNMESSMLSLNKLFEVTKF